MNDDLEHKLRQVTPRGAPLELRTRALGAVSDELNSVAPRRPRKMRPGLAVAATLLVSVGLNYWVNVSLDHRLATLFGPPSRNRDAMEISAEIARVTDPSTGQWAYERLALGGPRDTNAREYAIRLQQVIQQYSIDLKEIADATSSVHEAAPKNPQMDRDLNGSRDRSLADPQRLLRREQWQTA